MHKSTLREMREIERQRRKKLKREYTGRGKSDGRIKKWQTHKYTNSSPWRYIFFTDKEFPLWKFFFAFIKFFVLTALNASAHNPLEKCLFYVWTNATHSYITPNRKQDEKQTPKALWYANFIVCWCPLAICNI